MARYIDVDKIDTEKAHKRNEIYYRDSFESGVVSTLHLLAKMPTADVVEVKHAYWKVCEDECEICASEFVCSNCKESFVTSDLTDEQFLQMLKYCPNCGAKMNGK